ncbi:hypothetical protein HDU98_002561 [Podochytrium sp. JEL0797]|nr:hypothetical protein HDU98_002561 [Podochytrium sp. JEL0797]
MPGYIDNAAALDSYLHVKALKNELSYKIVVDSAESKRSIKTPSVNESVSSPKKSKRLSVFATSGQDGFFISNMHL